MANLQKLDVADSLADYIGGRMEARVRSRVKISISATNPCHLYPMAVELGKIGALGCYYSGYPRWKLAHSETLPIRAHSLRTNIVYGALKYLPRWARPESRDLFSWQDRGFDQWVGAHLQSCDFIHAMPGQCLRTFLRAKQLGIHTVLNHATGPVRKWVKIMEPEYGRVGLKMSDAVPYDAEYFQREEQEYALADFHCAASTVVRDQLIDLGITQEKIWLIPYGADARIFFPPEKRKTAKFRIIFAGQIGLRKGIYTLLNALELAGEEDWEMDFVGALLPEVADDLKKYQGKIPLNFHGAVSQADLGQKFRDGSVLVLPSLEEGFGLVVPQALSAGLPCIVSDCTGAKDLIRQRENGSIFQTRNSQSLFDELAWWAQHPIVLNEHISWEQPARTLLSVSESILS